MQNYKFKFDFIELKVRMSYFFGVKGVRGVKADTRKNERMKE